MAKTTCPKCGSTNLRAGECSDCGALLVRGEKGSVQGANRPAQPHPTPERPPPPSDEWTDLNYLDQIASVLNEMQADMASTRAAVSTIRNIVLVLVALWLLGALVVASGSY